MDRRLSLLNSPIQLYQPGQVWIENGKEIGQRIQSINDDIVKRFNTGHQLTFVARIEGCYKRIYDQISGNVSIFHGEIPIATARYAKVES